MKDRERKKLGLSENGGERRVEEWGGKGRGKQRVGDGTGM